jgi:hypothetical protein
MRFQQTSEFVLLLHDVAVFHVCYQVLPMLFICIVSCSSDCNLDSRSVVFRPSQQGLIPDLEILPRL